MRTILCLLALMAPLLGCETYRVARYAPSVDNIEHLKALRQKYPSAEVSVRDFVVMAGPLREIMCRGAGPVSPPDGQTFGQYLQKALIDEMKLAGVYAPESSNSVGAQIDAVDFSSFDGFWTLSGSVTAGAGKDSRIELVSTYPTAFMGVSACERTAQAFVPAAQDFVRRIIQSPAFESAFAASANQTPVTTSAVPGT